MHQTAAAAKVAAFQEALGALIGDGKFPPEAVPLVTAMVAVFGDAVVNLARIADALAGDRP